MSRREIVILFAIIGFGAMVRMYGIRQPFIDAGRRQEAETAMVAENFYRHGFNILFPQVNWGSSPGGRFPSLSDWADKSVGYAGTEFPLVSFLAAVVYLAAGVAEWPGRLLSVGFFALSVPFFYLVQRRILKTRFAAGIAAVAFSLMPLSVFMGREFMPDMASLCLSIIGLYFFIDAAENKSHFGSVWLAGAATAFAILLRLPAIAISPVFFYICWKRFGPAMYSTARLWGILALSFFPPLLWYGHAYQLSVAYPPHYFFWQSGALLTSLNAYPQILLSAATTGVTPFIAAAIAAGFFLPGPGARTGARDENYGGLFHWWFLTLLFYVAVAGGNATLWTQAALVPIGAAMTGRIVDFLAQRIQRQDGPRGSWSAARIALVAGAVLFLCGAAISSYGYLGPLYQGPAEPWSAGAVVDMLTPPGALVILPGDGNPAAAYYSRRRCLYFSNPTDESQAISHLEELRGAGATHIVFPPSTQAWLGQNKGFAGHLNTKYRRIEQAGVILFELVRPVAKPSGKPVVAYRLTPSAMRRFPNWMHAVLEQPPTDDELTDLAIELHARYPETHFHFCDDPDGLPHLDRVSDDPNLLFPENWFLGHYFGMLNIVNDGGHKKWRLIDPRRNNKILADLE